jgi:hypothetical protein
LLIAAAGLAAAFILGTLRIVDRITNAVDRRFGDWLYIAVVAVLFGAFAIVALAAAIAVAIRALSWSHQVSPNRRGLFAIVFHRGQAHNFNEPGAQTISAMSAHRRPTAPLAQRVIEANYRLNQPSLPEPAPLPDGPPEMDYNAPLPREVSLYSAPLPRELSLPVGVDAGGRQVAIPLRNRGCILIGGLSGGGKSELLAGFIAGLARQDSTGRRVQIAVCDMKLVSFGNMPPDLSILRWPVAVDKKPALELIEQVLEEVSRRYDLLQAAGARSLDGYIQRTGEPLAHMVVLIDEITDLSGSRVSRTSFVEAAGEIARKGRAAGVTLVMATQRPSTEALPADLRNQESAAVAFAVERPEDSRLILGRRGAELLPAIPGRCLVRMERAVVVQAYLAGLDEDGGHSSFDAFLAGLPRAEAVLQPRPPVGVLVPPTIPQPTANRQVVAPAEPVVTRKLERGRQPDAEAVALMRVLHRDHGWSMNRLCFEFYDYKDDVVLSYVRAALGIQKHATAAARRHRRVAR